MTYNFDEIVDRTNTNSIKYDFAVQRGKPADVLPLWVADMDFQTVPEILDAIHKVVNHGIFGYTDVKSDYFDILKTWFSSHYNWSIEPSWLIKTPGVVYAIAAAIRAFTKEGDAVMIQQPVYYPFSAAILNNHRELVNNSLVLKNGRYEMDFDDFEKKIITHHVKLFILCNPHNPVGRVWTVEELTLLGEICLKHQVLIVSDEIHADFIYPNYTHTVLASLNKELENNTITCTAPSKTFNLAGLQVSNILIPNQQLKHAFRNEIARSGYSQLNTLGLVASQAAYTYGEPWLRELKEYLIQNLSFTRTFIQTRLPKIQLIEPEGTYLIWLDCRGLGLDDEQLDDIIVNKAKLWLDTGSIFGEEGNGFQRINIACPRATLEKALLQLEAAIQ